MIIQLHISLKTMLEIQGTSKKEESKQINIFDFQ